MSSAFTEIVLQLLKKPEKEDGKSGSKDDKPKLRFAKDKTRDREKEREKERELRERQR